MILRLDSCKQRNSFNAVVNLEPTISGNNSYYYTYTIVQCIQIVNIAAWATVSITWWRKTSSLTHLSMVSWREMRRRTRNVLFTVLIQLAYTYTHTRARVAKTADKVHIFHFSEKETSRLKCSYCVCGPVRSKAVRNGIKPTNVRFRSTDGWVFLTFAAPCLFLPTHSRDHT